MAQPNPLQEITPKIVTNKTTCLFCTLFVCPKSYKHQELMEVHRILMHLCDKMEMDKGEIPPPQDCNEKRFPLCGKCKGYLLQLWELRSGTGNSTDETNAVLKKIMEVVFEGEKRLPGGEKHFYLVKLKGKNPDVVTNEPLKFMKLRNVILAARERALMSQQPPDNSNGQITTGDANSDGSRPGPSRAYSTMPKPVSNALEQTRRSRAPFRSDEQPRPSRANGSKGTGQPGPFPNTASAVDEGQHGETRAHSASQTRSKRHVIYKGVEIISCVDQQQGEFLKCGVCNHTVLVPPKMKYIKGDFSPKSIMEEHIKCAHKQQPVGRRVYECSRCSETFPTMRALQEHKKEHPSESVTICEICGRIINTSRSMIGVSIHQFTHKNDQERNAMEIENRDALDAGEKGAFNSFLDPANKRRRVRGSRSPFAKAGRSYPV